MKKATKVFICLSLIVLSTFFIFWIFRDKLAEPLYNYGLISDSAYCESRGGRIYVSSSYADATRTCKLEHSDVGKKCSDNNDCKGYCLINNRIYLKEKILELRKEDSKYLPFGKPLQESDFSSKDLSGVPFVGSNIQDSDFSGRVLS